MPSLPYVLALRAAETVINRALRYDPATRQRLQALDGKCLFVETESPGLSVMLRIQGERIRLGSEPDQRPHVTIEAQSAALLKLALAKQPQLIGGPLRIQGQVQVIEQLHAIARQMDIDWEEPVAMLFGDITGHQVGQHLRGLFGFARQAARTFVMNSQEYLREEQALLPARWEIDEFIEATRDLRADTERLEARLQRLAQRAAAVLARNAVPASSGSTARPGDAS